MIAKKTEWSKYVEIIFNASYLVIALIVSHIILWNTNDSAGRLWGVMGLVLFVGDCFHLVPRIMRIILGETERINKALGIGKLITSITMTAFYVLLFEAGSLLFDVSSNVMTITVYSLAIIRIAICIFPQNGFWKNESNFNWAVARNLPFLLLGAVVMYFFIRFESPSYDFSLMWLAIFLSFAFYIPVVLWSDKYPKLGMLMLPKSCVYILIITMGFQLIF